MRTVVLLVLDVIRATLAFSAPGAVPPQLSQREAGVRLVVESLYGSESSARAVARQDISEQVLERPYVIQQPRRDSTDARQKPAS